MAPELVELIGPNGPFKVTRKQANGVYASFERASKPKRKPKKKAATPQAETNDSEE